MAQIYTRAAARCREHPHRDTKERCSRCHQPFCADCLTPGPRAADGTRGWYCAPCAKLLAEAAAAEAHARTLRGRVERLQTAGSLLLPSLGATAVLVIVAAIWLLALRPQPERQTTCGELTRIRSVGAVGIVAPEEVVNAFAYPARASVTLMAPSGQPGQAGQSGQPTRSAAPAAPAAPSGADASGSASDPGALVDECETGWRSAGDAALPISFVFEPPRDGFWLQRVVLWQDPTAPRSTWIRDFQVLVSSSDSDEDFRPVVTDRPTQLAPSVEQQWFGIVQPASPSGVSPTQMSPEERARYAQAFPDIVFARRVMIRVLSVYGEDTTSAKRGPVSLGEVASYGPDLEVIVEDTDSGDFAFTCQVAGSRCTIHALSGRPVSIMLINQSRQAHTFVTSGQDRNISLRVEPGQTASGQFLAASRVGRYEFNCRLPGHAGRGLVGSIVVR